MHICLLRGLGLCSQRLYWTVSYTVLVPGRYCRLQAELDAAQGRLAEAAGEIEQLRRQQQEEHDNFEAGLHR